MNLFQAHFSAARLYPSQQTPNAKHMWRKSCKQMRTFQGLEKLSISSFADMQTPIFG